jgi:hypothetical protein
LTWIQKFISSKSNPSLYFTKRNFFPKKTPGIFHEWNNLLIVQLNDDFEWKWSKILEWIENINYKKWKF